MKKYFLPLLVITITCLAFIPPSTEWKGIALYLKDVDNVTQLSSITTAVEVEGRTGVITTVSSTLATDADVAFQVDTDSDTTIDATSQISLTVEYAGSSGVPYAYVTSRTDTAFTIGLLALQDTLNAVVKIHYEIRN